MRELGKLFLEMYYDDYITPYIHSTSTKIYKGKEYLEYLTERQTKTKPGDNPLNRRQIKPRTYENLSEPDERNDDSTTIR